MPSCDIRSYQLTWQFRRCAVTIIWWEWKRAWVKYHVQNRINAEKVCECETYRYPRQNITSHWMAKHCQHYNWNNIYEWNNFPSSECWKRTASFSFQGKRGQDWMSNEITDLSISGYWHKHRQIKSDCRGTSTLTIYSISPRILFSE